MILEEITDNLVIFVEHLRSDHTLLIPLGIYAVKLAVLYVKLTLFTPDRIVFIVRSILNLYTFPRPITFLAYLT